MVKLSRIFNIVSLLPIPGVSTASRVASLWLDRFERVRGVTKQPMDDDLKTAIARAAIQHLVKRLKRQNPDLEEIDDSELAQLLEESPEVAAFASDDPQILSEPERLESRMGEINRLLEELADRVDESPEAKQRRLEEQLKENEDILARIRERRANKSAADVPSEETEPEMGSDSAESEGTEEREGVQSENEPNDEPPVS
ncbi:MAG: hypothetical protein AB4040_13130 [Synechococcus sp.]